MAIPEAVERAGQLADRLYEEAYGKQGEQQTSAPADQQPAQQTEPAQQPEPPAAPPADSWEARYKVLTGKYNAEVPRLAADNRTLKDTVNELTSKVGLLTKQIEDVQSRAPAETFIKPEEIQEFGEPLVDMARRAAKEVMAQSAAPQQRELSEVRTELNDLKKSAAEIQWQNFIDLLTTIVPDWTQINVDTEFLAWLDGTDDLSGMTRQQLLDRAKNARDAQRVARFFTGWKEANQNKATTSRNALESHVVPDSSSRTVVPSGKKIFTRAQVQRAFDDMRAGRVTDAQAIVLEAEINAAMIEGRIR